nr:hypothetical protein [uncultured Desulfobacter sp.]
MNIKNEFRMPQPPTLTQVFKIAAELNIPVPELTSLLDMIGRQEVVRGLQAQGDQKFRETLSLFSDIGIEKCCQYIEILNDNKIIGNTHISQDWARAPYSIARVLEFLNNKELKIDDLYYIIPRLKESIGEKSYERGFPSWSLYYFFVTLKKIKKIGVDRFTCIISMLKESIGQEYICKAYEQGYLWFVEAMETFSSIGIERTRDLIEDFKGRSNLYYFTTSFAHNPRSFAWYIKKKKVPNRETNIIINGKTITGDQIITLLSELLNEHFNKEEYLNFAPSEFIAFIFDAVIKHLERKKLEGIEKFLRKKYFSAFSKKNVYSLLREIGPEIEIQKDLETYDVNAAHMAAFFFIVQSSGDALIEFPLGPAHYHGSLSEIIQAMGNIKIGQESLIPKNKIIPLDVSLSMPPGIIDKKQFQKKATLLRVVNDLLYTANSRLATAFQGYPMDQSGIRFKKGRAIVIRSKGTDLVENRSGNLCTDYLDSSVKNCLIAHEASLEFYQIMYSALAACFLEKPEANGFEKKLSGLFFDFEKQVFEILREENLEYLTAITSNENLAFKQISQARDNNKTITASLGDAVHQYLLLMNQEILKEAIQKEIERLRIDKLNIKSEILEKINDQKEIDVEYFKLLQKTFQKLMVAPLLQEN